MEYAESVMQHSPGLPIFVGNPGCVKIGQATLKGLCRHLAFEFCGTLTGFVSCAAHSRGSPPQAGNPGLCCGTVSAFGSVRSPHAM